MTIIATHITLNDEHCWKNKKNRNRIIIIAAVNVIEKCVNDEE